jgi:tRNA(Met) cytidine acetyltransferase
LTGKFIIDWLVQRQLQPSHRQLLLVSGDRNWCQRQTEYLLAQTTSPSLLLSNAVLSFDNNAELNFVTSCQISQYKQQLGTEYALVIYNAFDGLKPSAVYALEGTIGKTGLLVLMCPDLKEWQHYEAAHSGIAFSYNTEHATSLFISRMKEILLKDVNVACITPNTAHLPFAYARQNTQHNPLPGVLTSQQKMAFKSVLSNVKHDKSIALITAKRGRGKSTLLGQIAAALATQDDDTVIYITAPHINNAQRAQIEYKYAIANSNLDTVNTIHHGSKQLSKLELAFIAPDQLGNLPKTALLIVDEAAAIAPSIVLYACQNFAHVIMATTLAGYEGSGLGFKIRVLPKLQTLTNALTCVELHSPLRWYNEDSLETVFSLIFAPFVKDTATQSKQVALPADSVLHNTQMELANSYCHQLNKPWLIKNEQILGQVFNLLIQSHYQTTPDDLMRILDASEQHIMVLANSADITAPNLAISAVAIIVQEGKITFCEDDSLLAGVICSRRRVNGHLVAQNLAMTFCDGWFMAANSWRISRIAVKPELRRLGLGRMLLQEIRMSAEQNEVDFLSTSFGLTNELSHFWQSQAFTLLKIGARRDTSSGEHSGIMFMTLTERANDTFNSYRNVAINDIDYFLNHLLKNSPNMNSVLLTKIVIQQRVEPKLLLDEHTASAATHYLRCSQFIDNKRTFVNAAASIYYQLGNLNIDASTKLYALFIQAHQKNLSKKNKQEILLKLKISLLETLETVDQAL